MHRRRVAVCFSLVICTLVTWTASCDWSGAPSPAATTRRVLGRVAMPAGMRADGVLVGWRSGSSMHWYLTETNTGGEFRFEAVPAGEVLVAIRGDLPVALDEHRVPSEGDHLGLELGGASLCAARLVMPDGGALDREAWAWVTGAQVVPVARTVTRAVRRGRLIICGVQADRRYNLFVRIEAVGLCAEVREFAPRELDTVRLQRGGTFRGTVRGASSGDIVKITRGGVFMSVELGPTGAFEFGALPIGTEWEFKVLSMRGGLGAPPAHRSGAWTVPSTDIIVD